MHQRQYRLVKKWMESRSACTPETVKNPNHSISSSILICEARTPFRTTCREKVSYADVGEDCSTRLPCPMNHCLILKIITE